MWPEVLEAVTGMRREGEPAILKGYKRLRVIGEVYPALLESPADEVAGKLYQDLPETILDRLDTFEGEPYERIVVSVEGLSAYTYVLSRKWRHIADSKPWNPADITPAQLRRFV